MRPLWSVTAIAVASLVLCACVHGPDRRRKRRRRPPPVTQVDPQVLFERTVAAFSRARSKGTLDEATCKKLAGDFELADAAWREQEPVALFNAGAVWEACGKPGLAEAVYRELIGRRKSFAAAHNNLGVILWKRGQVEEASRQFKRAIDVDPHTPAPRNNMAAALRRRYSASPDAAAFEQAELELQNALAVDSNNGRAYENLARLYYDRGRLRDKSYLMLADLVVTQATRLLEELDRPSAEIYNLRGLLFMERGDKVNALRAFKKATQVDAEHRGAHMNIAMVALRFRSYEQAEASLRVALRDEETKRDVNAHLGLGVALRGQREYAAAEKAFKRALDVNGQDPRSLYNLGILYQEHLAPSAKGDGVAQNKVADDYFTRFIARAKGNKAYAADVMDARYRIARIKEFIDVVDKMKELERQQREAEARAEAEENKRREELLELEKRARDANPTPQ